MTFSTLRRAATFINWVHYSDWLVRSGHQPISWIEYLQLRGE